MRNALSWLLSILLHIAVAVFLLHSVQLEPLFLEKIMEVDLTQVEEPEPIVPMPEPEPISDPVPMEQSAVENTEELPAAAPLPMDKTVVLDDAPPLPPEPEPLVEAEPEPEAVEISTQKTLPPEEELAEDGKPKKIVIRKDITVHRGHEARFGRAMMGDYFSYSSRSSPATSKPRTTGPSPSSTPATPVWAVPDLRLQEQDPTTAQAGVRQIRLHHRAVPVRGRAGPGIGHFPGQNDRNRAVHSDDR